MGVRGVASVSKGHHKMLFSLVFTNAVWVEKVRCVKCVGLGTGLNCMGGFGDRSMRHVLCCGSIVPLPPSASHPHTSHIPTTNPPLSKKQNRRLTSSPTPSLTPTPNPPLSPKKTHTQVAFDAQGREWDDASLYWSDFSEYPEDVQDAFSNYLAERSVA